MDTTNVPSEKPTINLSFEPALRGLKDGHRIRRACWPLEMFVVMMPRLDLPPFNTQGTERKVNDRTAKWIGEDKPLRCMPYIAFYDGWYWQPGWLPAQADLFAEDWEIMN